MTDQYCLHATTERLKDGEQRKSTTERGAGCPIPYVGLQLSNPSFIESQLSHFDPVFFVREKTALPNIVYHCWRKANWIKASRKRSITLATEMKVHSVQHAFLIK